MNMIGLAERSWIPDGMIRLGIRRMLTARLRQESVTSADVDRSKRFAELLRRGPVAVAAEQANSQHYEVPSEFFEAMLGPRLKYSSCLYPNETTTLAKAEEEMLDLACRRAEIEDGMDLLDLGCGWGSLSLWIAEHYPQCRITAISNSTGQRRFIEARCRDRGFGNVRVVTANIAEVTEAGPFDRILSVEMLEHMRNYEVLFARFARWLRPAGKMFAHVFCHRELGYTFETDDDSDWMARHFFTGGVMPSFDLFSQFNGDLALRRSWQVDGRHYARTCEHWLANLDANRERIVRLFEAQHGSTQAKVVTQRWRIFLMSCAELFGFRNGSEWMVGHYLFEPTTKAVRGTGLPEAVAAGSGT